MYLLCSQRCGLKLQTRIHYPFVYLDNIDLVHLMDGYLGFFSACLRILLILCYVNLPQGLRDTSDDNASSQDLFTSLANHFLSVRFIS
jgi:hypothetical protein